MDITKPIAINNPDPALVDWECEVRTRGFGVDGSQTVIGVDSVHALFNALVLAGGLVGSSLVSLAAEIDWAEMDNYGFPRDPNANAGDAPIPPIPDPEF